MVKRSNDQSVTDKGKRQPTPPQTLFPDLQSAHSSILCKPTDDGQNSLSTDRRMSSGRPMTPPLPPSPAIQRPIRRQREVPLHQQTTAKATAESTASTTVQTSAQLKANQYVVGVALEKEDYVMTPLKVRPDPYSDQTSRAKVLNKGQELVLQSEVTEASMKNAKDNSEQDWATTPGSHQSDDDDDVVAEKALGSTFSTGQFNASTGTLSLDQRPPSPWSPLRKSFRAVDNLPALHKSTSPHVNFPIQRVHNRRRPELHTVISPGPSVAALSPRATAETTSSFPSTVLGLNEHNYPVSKPYGSSSLKDQPSPALQSSLLLPQHAKIVRSELPFTNLKDSEPSHSRKMDKGKGKVTDWSPSTKVHSDDSIQTEIQNSEGLELRYEDLFEEIEDNPDIVTRPRSRHPISADVDNTFTEINLTDQPRSTGKITSALHTSPSIATKGSDSTKLPRAMHEYNFANDANVSECLRATNPFKKIDIDAGPSQPINIPHGAHAKRSKKPHGRTGEALAHTTGVDINQHRDQDRKHTIPALSTARRLTFEDRLKKIGITLVAGSAHAGPSAVATENQSFIGVALSNGNRIGKPKMEIRNENNLPQPNSFGFADRIPFILHKICDDMKVRQRIENANDEWNRLQHECPQFPLRDEYFKIKHPVKKDRMKYERLEQLEDGEWLEQGYCTHHGRAEFSATKGIPVREMERAVADQQHKAGKLAVVWGCVLFPLGGFIVLRDLSENRGSAADIMRLASQCSRIDRPHEDERRLAGLMMEVMVAVWLLVVGGALAACIWALTQMQ